MGRMGYGVGNSETGRESAANREQRRGRKDEHVDLAVAQQPHGNDFDAIDFVHDALAAVDVAEVDLRAKIGPVTWPVPFYINGMTGGTEKTGQINRVLAIGAAAVGIPMATGSVSVALDNPATAASFRVIREENPHGFVMANIGAGRGAEDAQRAVDLVEADALQVHINAVQEIVMPEGDREFAHWQSNIAAIVRAVEVPVIVKEVGFGLSRRTVETLRELGVAIADVGGTGGTDFAAIENARRKGREYAYLAGYGLSTPACLLDAGCGNSARAVGADGFPILASGGIRTPFDAVKALALGARAAGVAAQFLRLALAGEDTLVAGLNSWKEQIRALLALLGAKNPVAATETDVIIRAGLREWCEARGIDIHPYAHRRPS